MKNAKNIIEPDFQHDESGVEANEKVIITKPFVSQIIEFYKAKNKVYEIAEEGSYTNGYECGAPKCSIVGNNINKWFL